MERIDPTERLLRKRPCHSSWKACTESNSNSDCWHTRNPHSPGGKK